MSSKAKKANAQNSRKNKKTVVQEVVQVVEKVPRPPGQGTSRSARRRRNRRGAGSMYSANGMNPYLESLINPEGTPGCKVPDLAAFPTGTFQLTYDSTISTPAAPGDSVLIEMSPYVNGLTSGSGAPIQLLNNAAAGGAYSLVSGTGWATNAAIVGAYLAIRPVSAEIYAEFIGSTLNDNGYIVSFLTPRDYYATGGTTPANVLAYPITRTYPLREGCRILWKPQDNVDFEFTNTTSNIRRSVPTIGLAVLGAVASTTVLKIRIVANFEGIPLSDTSTLVNAAPSPVNLDQVQSAFRWGQDLYSGFSSFVNSAPNLAGQTVNLLKSASYGVQAFQAARQGLNLYNTLGNARAPRIRGF